MNPSPARGLLVASLLLGALALGRGCGADEASSSAGGAGLSGASGQAGSPAHAGAPAQAGAPTAGQGGAAATAGHAGSAGQVCQPQPLPSGVPTDWRELTDWSCGCRFYVPGDTGALPPPIVWNTCTIPTAPQLQARCMATTTEGFAGLGLDRYMTLDPNSQKPLLWFSRKGFTAHPDHTLYTFAEADGPVRAAYLSPYAKLKGCDSYLQKSGGNHFAIGADGEEYGTKDPQARHGVLAGSLEDPYHPLVLRFDRSSTGLTSNWYASQSTLGGWLPGSGIRGFSWDGSVKMAWIYDQKDNPPFKRMTGLGDAFFLQVGDVQRAIARWSPADGQTWLLGHPFSSFDGWFNFGTDGHDMVWSHGQKKDADSIEYPTATVETAPYTLDATTLKTTTRVLRQDLVGPPTDPFVVGCGYAARRLTGNNQGLLVVRLIDGVSWVLPNDEDVNQMSYHLALGLTCEELFVSVVLPDQPPTIARLQLSSLGPGQPSL